MDDGVSEQDSKVTLFWAYTNMAHGLVIRLASTGVPAYQQAMHVRMCMEYGITWNKQQGRQAMHDAETRCCIDAKKASLGQKIQIYRYLSVTHDNNLFLISHKTRIQVYIYGSRPVSIFSGRIFTGDEALKTLTKGFLCASCRMTVFIH
jgi:hypothetical protein